MNSSTNEPALDTQHRILVVDDNAAIHEDFRKILAMDSTRNEFEQEDAIFFGTDSATPDEAPFELDFASQGREALEKVIAANQSGRPYSVVFMDVRMPPGWDGIETTARLWDIDPDLQVVICTAYSDYSWEEMVGRLGRTDRLLILKKPFDVIEVVQCAHALAGKWSLLQQTRRHAESLESTVRARTSELEIANSQLESEIVERRRSEEALRFTQFSVDNASDAMFWVAPDSRLLYVNNATCRILGYTVQELHAMNVLDIVPELREGGWQPFWESLRHDGHRIFEAMHTAKDGSQIPIELTATFFTFGGQELLCVSARDITLRQQILAELSFARDTALESVRLKSQFLANMSHEIRTPMNGVIGMAELMLHTNLDRDQREYVDTIRSSADLLLDIINDILDTAKIESGMLRFETRDFDLNEVIEGTMDIVGGGARNKGLELAGYVQGEVYPHLRGDAGRLRQVLTNIVSNAVKFTERGEVILSVSTLAESDTNVQLCFEVRDTGIGIAEDVRARIFEPFIQADNSDTRKYGGTGLGLTICSQIVEALGGSIGVESEPGKGSTFWINLSFKKQTSPGRPAVLKADHPTNLRVLVVDDNPTNREILQLQLANLQMRSTSVAGGNEALELLRLENSGTDPFHLAVLDGQMPVMDGLELARQIKSDPVIAATRLILLSSLGDHLTDTTLAAAGVEGYLIKPLKQTRLQAALITLFSSEPLPVPLSPTILAPESVPAPAAVRDRRLRILLAEDNAVNQRVALLQLKHLGYTADVANDGVEALKALESVPYDVILMDCQMPNMDGYTATREIRRIHTRSILIIAMTANAMKGDREKCLAAGMNDHLSKPVDSKTLGRLLTDHLASEPSLSASLPEPSSVDPAPVDLERLLGITGEQPEVFRQLSRDYLEQAEEILSHIVLAIERRNPREIRQLAHKLGGSSASCGMRAIVVSMKRLEQIDVTSQFSLASDLHQDAVRQLAAIRRFLIRYLDSHPSPAHTAP
ncbi:MAG: response regulator [Luteolibacter sp.]|uniref:response regulator n=1 Tax=Luteolibacter sp. TaxID=1962973 RepID=UPI0032667206